MNQIHDIQKQFEQDRAGGIDRDILRIKYLGRKGIIAEAFQLLPNLDASMKVQFGKELNLLKQVIEEALHTNKTHDRVPLMVNLEPIRSQSFGKDLGHLSPVTAAIFRIQEIFESLGFSVARGPELETEYYNFDSLNIPANHPARDVWDTIWVTTEDGQKQLLRTHTSPGQVRYMESHTPPLRVIIPGKVYRYEATDATHETCFHQVEGLMIGQNVSIAHFKGVIEYAFNRIFPTPVEVRLRPSYFPFTEPSFEIDVLFQGKWLELAGAGMVNRKVLAAGGITDPQVQGFAFGMGVERLVMLLTGLNDVRLIHSADLRVLYQFGIGDKANI